MSAGVDYVVHGVRECKGFVKLLWPQDYDAFKRMTPLEARNYLNDKTDLDVSGDLPGHFWHWARRLNKILEERRPS